MTVTKSGFLLTVVICYKGEPVKTDVDELLGLFESALDNKIVDKEGDETYKGERGFKLQIEDVDDDGIYSFSNESGDIHGDTLDALVKKKLVRIIK